MENWKWKLTSRHKPKYKLITIYKFVDIPKSELKEVAQEHLDFVRDLDIKCRIYIGTEWISSTLTGNIWQVEAYRWYLERSKYFKNIEGFYEKSSDVDGHKFPRTQVKIRDEIVKLWEVVTSEEIEKYKKKISPDEVKRIIDEQDPNYVILDMRNDYEYELWHLKWAMPAGTVNFREVPDLLERYEQKIKGKKVIWYCTWGIRCEKARALANRDLDTEFYAIDGWVMWYVNTHNDGNWLWNLYTFDDRVSMQVWDDEIHTTIGKCIYSWKLTNNATNCRYSECNARIIASEEEFRVHGGFCSSECLEWAKNTWLVKNASWDKLDYKALKNDTRQHPSHKDDNIDKVGKHLEEITKKVEYNHKTSQKEWVLVEY